jgi:hypothetical protein
MIHDTRVIPLDQRPTSRLLSVSGLETHAGIGGDTLVVETANYKPRSFMSTSSEQLHVVERFSQTGPHTLKYEMTINDPGTWTRPWNLMIPLSRADHPMYEYGCHEGNYGMTESWLEPCRGARRPDDRLEEGQRSPCLRSDHSLSPS